ncbi:MAG: hypothetical protein ABI612_04235 [Betaproteobacteria bacterium]
MEAIFAGSSHSVGRSIADAIELEHPGTLGASRGQFKRHRRATSGSSGAVWDSKTATSIPVGDRAGHG